MKNNYFFIIGAQRCGTTYLYHLLDEHPQICMAKPVKPEPKFFLNKQKYLKGKAYYISKYFKNCDQYVRGEKSTSYIEFDEAQRRIKSFFPGAKIIVVLRNPVTRAISNYLFSYKNGFEQRTLEEVFLQKKENSYKGELPSVSPFDYLKRGEYIRYLRRIYDVFAPEQVKIIFFENMISGIEYIAGVYKFLNVDMHYQPNAFNKVINASELKPDVSQKVVDILKRHFLSYNEELENFLKTNIEFWK
ncbi:MAG: sulfotransferase family protein [Thermotogota bacterium]